MDQHQRRIYDLAAELGDLEVHLRRLQVQLSVLTKAIEDKHQDIAAAIRLRDRKEPQDAPLSTRIDTAPYRAPSTPERGDEG